MNDLVIKANKLSKIYKIYSSNSSRIKEALSITRKEYHNNFYALKDVSFDVKKGETVGIIGTNGSGKSTLLKILTGVLQKTSGEIQIYGKISALLELGAGFNPEVSGIENIYLNGMMMGYNRIEMKDRLNNIIEFADIGDFIMQPVKTYSSGMFARLAFAVAINVEPDILIVDEALSVGDLFFQNKCFKKFEELKKNGVTILFVSHDLSSIRQMCSRVLWIEKGQQKQFLSSDIVCDAYMDMQRKMLNKTLSMDNKLSLKHIFNTFTEVSKTYPHIEHKKGQLDCPSIKIISSFITDLNNNMTRSIETNNDYVFHVVVKAYEKMENLIVGIVLENNKGLPLFDLNNYINQNESIKCDKNEILEVQFKVCLPRLMKGKYLMSAAIAQGTQEEHNMLTWLHSILELEIVNVGYNSSYIEIPCDIRTYSIAEKNLTLN